MPNFPRALFIRTAAVCAAALSLTGCISYTETPRPAPVVVTTPQTPPPTVVRPAY